MTDKDGNEINDPTTKQRAFIEHYLTCWNATEAARRAGYSAKTAQEQGSRLLSNVIVEAAIDARITELKAGADEVLLRLADHARSTVEDFIDDAGEVNVAAARERRKLHLVKKLKQNVRYDKDGGRTVTTEIELHDAQAATVQLGRALGVFVDKVAPTDPSGQKEYGALTDEERAARALDLLERARARRDGRAAGGASSSTPTPGDGGPAPGA